MKSRVSVWMGGPSGERAVSLESGRCVAQALESEGFRVQRVEITPELAWRVDGAPPRPLAEALPSLAWPDVVFPALHGPFGEDGTVQGFLETLRLPYVGSGVAASALAMDKEHSRTVAAALGITVAPAVVGGPGTDDRTVEALVRNAAGLTRPLFVKPVCLGSSVGISRVADGGDLATAVRAALREGGRVVIEQGIPGREMSCPVLGDAHAGARALPVIAIVPRGADFFDYEAKYTPGATDEICPAPIDDETARALQELAVRVHDAFGCRSLSRTDVILPVDGGAPVFLEVNTLPGLTEVSLFPKAGVADGLSYPALCGALVRGVIERGRAPRGAPDAR